MIFNLTLLWYQCGLSMDFFYSFDYFLQKWRPKKYFVFLSSNRGSWSIKDRALYLKYNSWEKCLNSGEKLSLNVTFFEVSKFFNTSKKLLCQEQKLLKILLICHNWSTYQLDTHPSFFWGQRNKSLAFCPFYCYSYLCTSIEFEQNFFQSTCYCFDWSTLVCWIDVHARLLFFRKNSHMQGLIWVYMFIVF